MRGCDVTRFFCSGGGFHRIDVCVCVECLCRVRVCVLCVMYVLCVSAGLQQHTSISVDGGSTT